MGDSETNEISVSKEGQGGRWGGREGRGEESRGKGEGRDEEGSWERRRRWGRVEARGRKSLMRLKEMLGVKIDRMRRWRRDGARKRRGWESGEQMR